MNSNHALICGGAGFVGRHLARFLLQKEYHVTLLDSFITSKKGAAEKFLTQTASAFSSNHTSIEGDIIELWSETTQKALKASVDRLGPFTEIYNLASPASPMDFEKLPDYILQTGSVGQRNLLKFALPTKTPVLFASSSEVYGDALVHPQPESYFGNVNPIGPRGCYDEAKRYGEAISMAWKREFGSQIRIARIFNTYGPGMRLNDGRVIPNFFVQALQKQALSVHGEGEQTRSFCYVDDLVHGLYLLMKSGESLPVNLGSTFEYKVLEVARMVNTLTENTTAVRFLPMPENDPKVRRPDLTRATSLLNWKPKVELKDGLLNCLEYFRKELNFIA